MTDINRQLAEDAAEGYFQPRRNAFVAGFIAFCDGCPMYRDDDSYFEAGYIAARSAPNE